jgi:hypothetical protein
VLGAGPYRPDTEMAAKLGVSDDEGTVAPLLFACCELRLSPWHADVKVPKWTPRIRPASERVAIALQSENCSYAITPSKSWDSIRFGVNNSRVDVFPVHGANRHNVGNPRGRYCVI